MNETYQIRLNRFEGPFDLLLFFIERDELDIQDIPIGKITADFLDYMQQMAELNIELASEFILVAATLIRIKARMLLPRPELDEQGEEIDPRADLAARLLEYKRYKAVTEELQSMEQHRQSLLPRGNKEEEWRRVEESLGIDQDLLHVDLYQLLKYFHQAVARGSARVKVVHKVTPYPYSIAAQRNYLANRLNAREFITFEDLFLDFTDKMQAIFTFLAMLEMLQVGRLEIETQDEFNRFGLRLKA
ncbi:MAG: chromosome segregation protein ScpA [Cytophagia bacterium]|nr:chromosome segregation protein ScpA [Cytophagia bacterium]